MVTGDDEWVLPEEVAAAMLALIENDVLSVLNPIPLSHVFNLCLATESKWKAV